MMLLYHLGKHFQDKTNNNPRIMELNMTMMMMMKINKTPCHLGQEHPEEIELEIMVIRQGEPQEEE
jgi:hypothetical protein